MPKVLIHVHPILFAQINIVVLEQFAAYIQRFNRGLSNFLYVCDANSDLLHICIDCPSIAVIINLLL